MTPKPGPLQKQGRKLSHKIGGDDVYVVDLVNDDLDRIDEISDEYAELERAKRDLAASIDACDDAEERKDLRGKVRELTREQRTLDVRMLGVYVEDKNGDAFDDAALTALPVRVQTALIKQATKLVYDADGDEGPTPGASDAR